MADQISTNKERSSPSQTQLDGLVVNIELTLISIIQGVAFSFLADNSSRVLVNRQFKFWPYAITGLLIILLFWSRSLIHTLTVIRWPLKFGHNFMYVACTLVETIAFTQLTNPLHWYALNSVFALLAGILFALDLRLIRDRIADSAGQIGCRLYAIVEREQLLNIRLVIPTTLIFNLLAMLAAYYWALPFVAKGGHVIVGMVQLGATIGYLVYVTRFFTRIIPLIVQTRQEWRDDVRA